MLAVAKSNFAASSKLNPRSRIFFSFFAVSKLISTSSAYPRYPETAKLFTTMGRNLYILAGTIAALSLLSIVLSFTNIAQQPGSPGDASLWRMTSIALLCVALIIALGGILSSLFEQAERRHSESRQQDREQKRRRRSE